MEPDSARYIQERVIMRQNKILLLALAVGLFATSAFSMRKRLKEFNVGQIRALKEKYGYQGSKTDKLIQAILYRDIKVVEKLAKKVDVNKGITIKVLSVDSNKKEHGVCKYITPVSVAISEYNLDAFTYLVNEAKANVRGKNYKEWEQGKEGQAVSGTFMEYVTSILDMFEMARGGANTLRRMFPYNVKDACKDETCERCKESLILLGQFIEILYKRESVRKEIEGEWIPKDGSTMDYRKTGVNPIEPCGIFFSFPNHKRKGRFGAAIKRYRKITDEKVAILEVMKQILTKHLKGDAGMD